MDPKFVLMKYLRLLCEVYDELLDVIILTFNIVKLLFFELWFSGSLLVLVNPMTYVLLQTKPVPLLACSLWPD